MSVTLRHLRAFECVARVGSFTRAADALHISQPGLTATVRQLEEIVGVGLFERTTRRVILTPEGNEFLPTAQRLLHDFDVAIEDLKSAAKRWRGRVGVACVFSIATKILPPAIQAFAQAHPAISVHLIDGNSADVRRRVRRADADIGFASMDHADPELEFAPLFRDQFGLLCRRDHPIQAIRRSLTWADLADHDFLGFAPGTVTRPILESIENLPASVRSPRYEVSNQATLEAMLASGAGLTIVPALTGARAEGDLLRFRAIGEPVKWRTISVITRKGRKLAPAALDLVEAVTGTVRRIGSTSTLIDILVPARRAERRKAPRAG